MILIDAVYINSSGGKKILNLFLMQFKDHLSKNYEFLFDDRVDDKILKIVEGYNINLIKPEEKQRSIFYKKISKKLTSSICLANIPPPIKLKSKVFIYFHNDLFLSPNKAGSLLSVMILSIKKLYIYLKKSENYAWVVQTQLMKNKLSSKLLISKKNIHVLPIFEKKTNKYNSKKNKNTFLYVCSKAKHKNLKRLIDAFNIIQNKHNIDLYLNLTIDDEKYFIEKVFKKNKNPRLKIINNGILNSTELKSLYSKSEFLIYPSLIESLGLPLIEAINCDCKVISADLPYVHEVIIPSLIFNPYSVISIANSIDNAINNKNLKKSKLVIINKIDKFIDLISK